jgi:glutathione S-transferase
MAARRPTETSMKLYYKTGACSLSPHIVLRELGIPFELEKVDTKIGKTQGGADFAAINPKGYVPVLQLDDGSVLTEGAAIVQYLADQRPQAGLAPANGTLARYRLQEWLNYIATELHKGFSPLFNKTFPAEVRQFFTAAQERKLAFLAGQLADRPYAIGDSFTVADAYLFTVLRWARLVEIDLARWPVLTAYLERVRARPAVQAAFEAEGLKLEGLKL